MVPRWGGGEGPGPGEDQAGCVQAQPLHWQVMSVGLCREICACAEWALTACKGSGCPQEQRTSVPTAFSEGVLWVEVLAGTLATLYFCPLSL